MSDVSRLEFFRDTQGIRLVGYRATFFIDFADLGRLNEFTASGRKASTSKLQRNADYETLRSATTESLERELQRRAEVGTE